MSGYLTIEEKIDYIFKELNKQKKSRLIKLIIKIIIVLLLIWSCSYYYFIILNNPTKDEIMADISKNISKIVAPIAKDITNEILKESANEINAGYIKSKILNNSSSSTINANKITNSFIEDLLNNIK